MNDFEETGREEAGSLQRSAETTREAAVLVVKRKVANDRRRAGLQSVGRVESLADDEGKRNQKGVWQKTRRGALSQAEEGGAWKKSVFCGEF
ncbi:hypothetical protein [Lignipirellula cremea]|uniref:hypothetical protein n=1 Tax=Lignipirellula cremea TaxID=2528010 RepID=UPI0011AA5219|nr:hypothetical protein [Lignipirellula cremea]